MRHVAALAAFTALGLAVAGSSAVGQDRTVTLETVNPDSLYDPAPNGYSHAIIASGVSRLAFIAGQGGERADGSLPPDLTGQIEQAYRNLAAAISAVGATPRQVTRLTTYVADYDQDALGPMTRALVALFGDHLPAQTLVPVPRLALDGMLFEVDAVVALAD